MEIDPVSKFHRVPTCEIFSQHFFSKEILFFCVGPSSRRPGRSPVTLHQKITRQFDKFQGNQVTLHPKKSLVP